MAEAEDFGAPVNLFEGYSPEAAFEAGWDKAARRFEPHKARAEAAEAALAELQVTAEALLGDRERALESDRHRIRADDAEARVAELEAVLTDAAEALKYFDGGRAQQVIQAALKGDEAK